MATDAGDQYLATLSEMQENFLKATSAYASKFTAPPAPVENPYASMFPSPTEMTEAGFSFAQKLLAQQKTFAQKLLAASAPAK
jgi:hypothetical protein